MTPDSNPENTPRRARPAAAAQGRAADEPVHTIGVAGGGQLARMLAEAASKLGLRIVVLDPDAHCSAATTADELLVGAFDSGEGLRRLADACELITFEIEQVDSAALESLERADFPVNPSASVLATIQDKLVQKRFLHELGIPTAAFTAFEPEASQLPPRPYVWKARSGGYDGRGVAVIRTPEDESALPPAPALLEDLVDIAREFAIIVARDVRGDVKCYPLTDIHMDPDAHVLDTVVAPATATPGIEETCRRHARKIADALDYVGVMAVELFEDREGRVYVNELSPRPHNSGHYSIEACVTSQFEQHLRAVAGLPLGSCDLTRAAATFNLLGPTDPERVAALAAAGELGSGVYVHDYEKRPARPGRKLGHVTVIADTADEALARAGAVKRIIFEENRV